MKVSLLIHLWAKRHPEWLILSDYSYSKQTIVDWFRFCKDAFAISQKNTIVMKLDAQKKIVATDENVD